MQDIRLVFLGTSSGMPSAERNVSSVALFVDGRVLLFDCGEGTQHQFMRAPIRMTSIDAIFISHLHGDHVYGLPGLLATLSMNARERPLDLYGPPGLRAFVETTLETSLHHPIFEIRIHELSGGSVDVGGFTLHCAFLDHTAPCLGWRFVEDDRPGEFDVARARELGVPEGPLFGRLQHGETIEVNGRTVHPSDVLGSSRRGRRVVYVTDTRPCAAAIELARDADVLVHESTYASDMESEARERAHSTAAGAARVAREANARRLILTHFSTRYSDVTPLVGEARAIFPDTEAARDLAVFEVRPAD